MKAEQAFWKLVESRRNAYFWGWAGFVPAAAIFFVVVGLFFEGASSVPNIFHLMFLVVWGVFLEFLNRRFKKIACVNCGKRAFEHPLHFMKDMKCIACGYSMKATEENSTDKIDQKTRG